MPERNLQDRVDDAILATSFRLSKLRAGTIRGAIADVRQSCVENIEANPDPDIWRLRIDRCDQLATLNDAELRAAAKDAFDRDERGR